MGKEAKIGLAVLGSLAIIFGVVVYQRFSGPAETPSAAANSSASAKESPDKDSDARQSGSEAAQKTLAKKPSIKEPARPKVVPAKQASSTGSDRRQQSTPIAVAPALPPSYFPDPPRPAQRDLNDQYANRTQPSTLQRWQTNRAGVPPYGPAQQRTVPGTTAAQTAPGPNPVRVLNAPAGQVSSSGGYRYPGSGQYSPPGNSATPAQSYQPRGSRYTGPPAAGAGQYPVSRQVSQSGSPYGAGTLRNEEGEYEIQPNDSYWIISEKLYGSGAYFKALAEHNRERFPRENQLAVGEIISAPRIEELEKTYPGLCPSPERREVVRNRAQAVSTRSGAYGGRTYTVEEGDTLFDVARYELGKSSRWAEIWQLNREAIGKDYNYLTPGMQLILPPDRQPEIVTQHPGTRPLQ